MWFALPVTETCTAEYLSAVPGLAVTSFPITVPRDIPVVAFPEDSLDLVIEHLGLTRDDVGDRLTTDVEGVQLLNIVRKFEYSALVEGVSERSSYNYIPSMDEVKALLSEFAYRVGKNTKMKAFHFQTFPSVFDADLVQVCISSSDRVTGYHTYARACGYDLTPDQAFGVAPCGDGFPIVDDEGIVVGELSGTTVYLYFDIFHDEDNALDILKKFLGHAADVFVENEAELHEINKRKTMRILGERIQQQLRHDVQVKEQEVNTLSNRAQELQEALLSTYRHLESEQRYLNIIRTVDFTTKVDAMIAGITGIPEVRNFSIENDTIKVITGPLVVDFEDKIYYIGSYQISVGLDGRNLRVLRNPGEPRTGLPTFVHPHVMNDGNMCLGAFANDITKALASYHYDVALTLVINALCTHDAGSCYNPITGYPVISEEELARLLED